MASLKVNGLTVTNPLELSNEFNDHFANIGPKLASEINCDNGSYQSSLQAGSSVENGARSKYKGLVTSQEGKSRLVTKPLYFDRAPFSTEEPACMLLSKISYRYR